MESQLDRLARKIAASKARAAQARNTPVAPGISIGADGKAYTHIPTPGSRKPCGCGWGVFCHKCKPV